MWNWLTWQIGAGIGGALLLLAALVVARRGGIGTTVLGWLVVAVLVAGGVLTGLLWLLGWPTLPPGAAFGPPQLLELLKIALAVVAGLGGVVLLAVNLRKQRVAEQEHDLAVERGDREETQAFNERFGAAAEQLAHTSAAVRLAGVYAMAGLADDWSAKDQVCVDVLCGYLRLSSGSEDADEREVRAAVLKVVRERTAGGGGWSALDFDFSDVVFENADFGGLTFRGALVLDRADFTGSLTSFADTRFQGALSCHGTNFLADRTTFAEATFAGARIEFVGARFANVSDFSRTELSRATVDFFRCTFAGIKADFSRLTVRGGTFRFDRCDFASVPLDLSRPNQYSFHEDVPGRIVLERCRVDHSTLFLQDVSLKPRLLWFVGSRFEDVEFTVAEEDRDFEGWLNLRDCELAGGTEIPDSWIQKPGSWAKEPFQPFK